MTTANAAEIGRVKNGSDAAVGKDEAAAQALVEQRPEDEAEHERRHLVAAPAQEERADADREHRVDVEQARRAGERADGAEQEDDRHQHGAADAQDQQQRLHQEQAEDQDRDRRERGHRDHLVDEVRMLDQHHRPGLDAVDDHRRHQHRRRRRARDAERERRDDVAGDRRHVAGLRGHQAVDRALAELLLLARRRLRGGVRHPRARVLADAGQKARENADHARAEHGRPVLQHLAKARQHRVLQLDELLLGRIGERRQDLGEAERADQRRDQRDAARELVPAEGEPVVRVEAFLADLRDEEAERAHQPALERIVADDRPRHRHAEQGEPEELVGAERERDLGERRRECGQADDAEQRSHEGARRGDADRAAGLAALGERIAVGARRGVGGGARDVEQDRGARAAVERADVRADQDQDRVVGRQLDRERRQERDHERRRQARQDADDDAEQRAAEAETDRDRVEKAQVGVAQVGEAAEHRADLYGRRTRNRSWNT